MYVHLCVYRYVHVHARTLPIGDAPPHDDVYVFLLRYVCTYICHMYVHMYIQVHCPTRMLLIGMYAYMYIHMQMYMAQRACY